MYIIRTIERLEQIRSDLGGPVGFVPTMGYLHTGHLALIRQARVECKQLVVSIFVNPTQFGPHEDLERYPRDLERDLHLLETSGVDLVFVPTAEEMYPHGFTTYVDVQGPLVLEAEGALRPNHFRGVSTVVLKLFQLVQPHRAYFGQKDAQQVAVITRMVADLNLPVSLQVLPTIREEDGLAMSSRNSYLDPAQRTAAQVLYRGLLAGQAVCNDAPRCDTALILQAVRAVVASEPLAHLDYVELRSATTFQPQEHLEPPALLLIAAHIGTTRLIDNFAIHADGTWDTGVLVSQFADGLPRETKPQEIEQ